MSAKKAPARREDDDPAKKFETLARRLIAVPKKEIDREVKDYERKRKRA